MPDVFRWRSLLREKKIYDMFNSHVELTHQGIDLISKAIGDLCQCQYKKEDILIDKVVSLEKDAEKIISHATEAIAQSRLTSVEAHDLLDLVFHIEKVAQKTKGAAIRLDWADNVVIPSEIQPNLCDVGKKLVEIFNTLEEALKSLSRDEFKKAVDYSDKVDSIEEEIDNIRRDAQRKLYDMAEDIKIGDLRKMEAIIEYLEAIADSCEDAADTIRLITIKHKG
ncbi:DUF47 domain-containing protein [Candidatus Altiarchaeota archaeon]